MPKNVKPKLYVGSELKYNNTSEIEKADWAALFNVTNKIKFEIALNTTDPRGTLDEVSIAYQCWSPETGQITHDCRMEVE